MYHFLFQMNLCKEVLLMCFGIDTKQISLLYIFLQKNKHKLMFSNVKYSKFSPIKYSQQEKI